MSFARTAKDGGRDLAVFCQGEARNARANGIAYAAEFYRFKDGGSKPSIEPLKDLNETFITTDLYNKQVHDVRARWAGLDSDYGLVEASWMAGASTRRPLGVASGRHRTHTHTPHAGRSGALGAGIEKRIVRTRSFAEILHHELPPHVAAPGKSRYVSTQPLDFVALYGDIQRWEGVVTFMYLDTAKPPCVTVGTGNMLPDIPAAQALPFLNTDTGQPATKDEVARAFHAVAAMKGGMRAKNYKQKLSIEITDAKAKELALKRLKTEFIPKLRQLLNGFDGFPLPARRAFIDMVYNMGIGGPAHIDKKGKNHKASGLFSFRSLRAAAGTGDWLTASLHCERRNPDKNEHTAKRNAWTKALFEQADREAHAGGTSKGN